MLVAALATTVAATASVGSTQNSPTAATGLTPAEVIDGAKSLTGALAKSDPSLLGRTDTTPVNVMVKFDVDPTASYVGGVEGIPATSPRATGRKLKNNRGAVARYEAYLSNVERDTLAAIKSAVPNAAIGQSYRTVYGGASMQVPANRIGAILALDGVAAVQLDRLEQPLTDVSPDWVGASGVWPSLGGSSRAGEGVIVGVIDTGIWPEHPSYADPGIDHPGGTYGCEFGNGGDAAFACNDKLIGAYAKTATYMSIVNALPGENCINATDVCSARDSDGHGTHTSSTAAGGPVASAQMFGVERGPISGVAPGAHVIMYRVCLQNGCFQSDSVAAVAQAIVDGADVLNFSISGGASAYTDPVELAFLDAYNAGILVNASAGNSGPGAATAAHGGPWTNTVGASTSDRHFVNTLRITADNGDVFTVPGATVTAGISTPTPVVVASEVPGQPNGLCAKPGEASLPAPGVLFAPGSLTGKIVVCRREAGARVLKSHNAFLGGAAGMILYNGLPNLGLNTDSHWIPTTHIEHNGPAGTHPLIAFLDSHTGETATFTAADATEVRGDVMTSFSSRGPVGNDFIKPDVTAPGIQILAGATPDPHDTHFVVGPPGSLFQAIAGTSMSSPHAAGVSALVKAAHPDWTPGQIKSALMTSSVQDVLKENGTTPSDPFDRGAGSVRANRAVNPTLTFDVTPAEYFASAADPINRVHLNLPSINASPMTGVITTTRRGLNVSGETQPLKVETKAPAGATIDVSPKNPVVSAGGTLELTVTINATGLANGQYFGEIRLDPNKGGFNDVVLPVAFRKGPGVVTLTQSCEPTTIARRATSDCTVQAQNLSSIPSQTSITVTGPQNGQLTIQNPSSTPAGVSLLGPGRNGLSWNGVLSPALAPEIASLTPGGAPFGFFPLGSIGVAPQAFGDETFANFNVNPFTFGTEAYSRVAVSANGYVVIGGGTSADSTFVPQTFPNPARPNNVLAPYWTDLNPAAGGAVRVAQVSSGANRWLVVEWNGVPVFTSGAPRSFQVWIQQNVEKVTYAFGPSMGPGDPEGLNTGAENRDGTSGKNLGSIPAANSSLTVNATPPIPGGMVTIDYEAFGRNTGVFDLIASLTSNAMNGTATEKTTITVTP